MAYVEFKTNPLYVQGEGALEEIKRYTAHLGSRFLILLGCGPLKEEVEATIRSSFESTMESKLKLGRKDVYKRYGGNLPYARKCDAENREYFYRFVDCDSWLICQGNVDAGGVKE